MNNGDYNDNGFWSRKLLFSILTSVLVVMCGILSTWWDGLANGLSAVVSGLLGVLALYSGANVTSKIFADKAEAKVECEAECEAEPVSLVNSMIPVISVNPAATANPVTTVSPVTTVTPVSPGTGEAKK